MFRKYHNHALCVPTHGTGTVKRSHRAFIVTIHLKDNNSKATSFLFLFKMISTWFILDHHITSSLDVKVQRKIDSSVLEWSAGIFRSLIVTRKCHNHTLQTNPRYGEEKAMCGSRGETGDADPPPLLKNHKNKWFLREYWSGSSEKSQSWQAII